MIISHFKSDIHNYTYMIDDIYYVLYLYDFDMKISWNESFD